MYIALCLYTATFAQKISIIKRPSYSRYLYKLPALVPLFVAIATFALMTISTSEILLRLLTASVLGSLIGLERERKDGNAGLRTHMLVCLGSSLIMIVSAFGFNDIVGKPGIMLDPSRVAAQVVSGIGFLGAGTILFLRPHIIKGLTTAAGLWSVAGVGLAVGGGLYLPALAATAIILLILAFIKLVEKRFLSARKKSQITLLITRQGETLSAIQKSLVHHKLSVREIIIRTSDQPDKDFMKLFFSGKPDEKKMYAFTEAISNLSSVAEVASQLQ